MTKFPAINFVRVLGLKNTSNLVSINKDSISIYQN
jgi:hypothetical protein